MATVKELLEPAIAALRVAGSETPRLDAELLLGNVLGVDRTAVLAHPEAAVGDGQRAAFASAVERRASGEPVAYIRGVKEFYGLAFSVDPRALIPRPETELLVELGMMRIREALTDAPRGPGDRPYRVLDVGTGCGAIAVAVAATARRRGYGPAIRITASDISDAALELAVENAVGHGVADSIDFRVADLVDPAVQVGGAVDLLLANLPYVPTARLPTLPVAASFEPALALDGGHDGLTLVRRLLEGLPAVLDPNGRAILEVGEDQVPAVEAAVAEALPGWGSFVHADLAGSPRAVEVAPPGALAVEPDVSVEAAA